MATLNKLTDTKCRNAGPGDKLIDGGGLQLRVQPNGSKLWQYRFAIEGRESTYSIGTYPKITLQKARELHLTARKLVSEGRNPTTARNEARLATTRAELAKKQGTFKAQCDLWLDDCAHQLADTTVEQRRREIQKDLQLLLPQPLADITRAEIVKILRPVQARAPEVAKNLRQYIWDIFESAITNGSHDSNPAPPSKLNRRTRVKNHPALLGDRIGDLLHAIAIDDRSDAKSRVATKLVALTVCRKREATGARWSEFNFDKAEWVIPAERMKNGVEHWVPLSSQASKLLQTWQQLNGSDGQLLFSNRRDPKRPMAGGTLNALFVRLGFKGEGTPHGLRAGFSTHFNKQTPDQMDVIERCLAHVPKDEVRSAYNRYKYESERTNMLQGWADHLEGLQKGAAARLMQQGSCASLPGNQLA
jgi:integrase